MKNRLLSLALLALPAASLAQTVYMNGLNAPRGLFVDADGTVYVAEAGTGGVSGGTTYPIGAGPATFGLTGGISKRSGAGFQIRLMSNLPSLSTVASAEVVGTHDILRANDGRLAVLTGFGSSPATRTDIGAGGERLGTLSYYDEGTGTWTLGTDYLQKEMDDDPDGNGVVDSDPFGFAHDGSGFAVADAGANAAWIGSGATAFSARDVPFGGGTRSMESVPTSIVAKPGGGWTVGELTGFPFVQGRARLFDLAADGTLLGTRELGFTNIVDLAYDSNGDLLVLEYASTGILTGGTGSIKRLRSDNVITTIVSGLQTPTSLALSGDGWLYVTNKGYQTGVGEVLRYAYTPVPEPASLAAVGLGLAALARRRRKG